MLNDEELRPVTFNDRILQSAVLNNIVDVKGIEDRLERIENAVIRKPVSNLHIDGDGLAKYITAYEKKSEIVRRRTTFD